MENQKKQEIKSLFVTYEIAIKLKEKGFDEPCFRGYNSAYTENNKPVLHDFVYGELQTNTMYEKRRLADVNVCTAPLWQQVIDWLRINHNIDISITNCNNRNDEWEYRLYSMILSEKHNLDYDSSFNKLFFNTYEEAKQAAIEHALTLI